MLGRSDWRSMGSHRAAFPGMFAEDLPPDRHVLSRLSSSVNIFTPSFCCMAVSLSLNIAVSLLQEMVQLLLRALNSIRWHSGGVNNCCMLSAGSLTQQYCPPVPVHLSLLPVSINSFPLTTTMVSWQLQIH